MNVLLETTILENGPGNWTISNSSLLQDEDDSKLLAWKAALKETRHNRKTNRSKFNFKSSVYDERAQEVVIGSAMSWLQNDDEEARQICSFMK